MKLFFSTKLGKNVRGGASVGVGGVVYLAIVVAALYLITRGCL